MDDELQKLLVALLPRLRRFAVTLAGSVTDGDDLVQAACERALARHDQWQPGTRLDSWVYRIIRTVWIDELRKRKRRSHEPLDGAATEAGFDGERWVEAKLTLNAVRGLIAALPEEQRVVLLLVCADGLTYREAAEALEIPVGTVMSRLGRARLALWRELAGP